LSITSVRFAGGWGVNGPLVEDDPTAHLVTENFDLGVSFDPPPVPLQQHQHNIHMTSRYFCNQDISYNSKIQYTKLTI